MNERNVVYFEMAKEWARIAAQSAASGKHEAFKIARQIAQTCAYLCSDYMSDEERVAIRAKLEADQATFCIYR